MVTGTSIVAVTFDGGVMLAADTLGRGHLHAVMCIFPIMFIIAYIQYSVWYIADQVSLMQLALCLCVMFLTPSFLAVPCFSGSYGSLARFRSLSRIHKVNDTTTVAASGDYADFQYIERLLDYLK